MPGIFSNSPGPGNLDAIMGRHGMDACGVGGAYAFFDNIIYQMLIANSASAGSVVNVHSPPPKNYNGRGKLHTHILAPGSAAMLKL